jgi:three-Cys-motif partner protein
MEVDLMSTKEIFWDLEPHTEAKHIILRYYLQAWFRIVGSRFPRILLFDGFAGPGEYSKGEDGSPILAIKEAMNFLSHCDVINQRKPEIYLKFVEQSPDRYIYLKNKIERMNIKREIKIQITNESFEDDSGKYILDTLKSTLLKGMPSFLFIDPFGYDLSFELIKKLMKHDKCEVFINFMYEFVNRFIGRDGQETVMNRLFGTTNEWKNINDQQLSPSKRKVEIHGLYQSQLEKYTAKYVRSFEMKGKRDTTKYFLFYGTNHRLGLEKMKESMWKFDKSGSFSFSDATDPNQLVLFGNEPNFAYLKKMITTEFNKQEATIESIEDFIICKTPFLKTHYKRQIFIPMEKNKEFMVTSLRKKPLSYPEGTTIRFN